MKATVLERYARTEDGRYVIDITAGKTADLYNDLDKHAPYVRKDLNQDLVDYLIESARDLGREKFTIQIHIFEPPDDAMKERITSSINSYFLYLKTVELNELARTMRTSFIFFVIGLIILFFSVWVNQQLADDATVLTKVFAEGLTVAAWVSLWEALATFLVNWTPYTRQIKLYERIAGAPVSFSAAPVTSESVLM